MCYSCGVEEFRLRYPLDASSLVLDAGAFRGDFIAWCRGRWDCRVIAFEPTDAFFRDVTRRFEGDKHVRILNYGVGGKTESVPIAIQSDATSVYLDAHRAPGGTETVLIKDVVEVFAELMIERVDLFKINIEGGEYALLPRMLDSGLVPRVRYFQVQYHAIGAGPEGPGAARDRIRTQLDKTHKEEWCVHGGRWESWALR